MGVSHWCDPIIFLMTFKIGQERLLHQSNVSVDEESKDIQSREENKENSTENLNTLKDTFGIHVRLKVTRPIEIQRPTRVRSVGCGIPLVDERFVAIEKETSCWIDENENIVGN